MRIAIATPLYPPDSADTALYVKDLAARLAKDHTVTLLAYAYLPEKVPGVRIVSVDKRAPLPVRLVSFLFALMRELPGHDLTLAINGASVELPVTVASYFSSTPYVLMRRDIDARLRTSESFLLRSIEAFARARAQAVVESCAGLKPEVLPLEPPDEAAWQKYEASWDTHLSLLRTYGA